MKSTIRSESGRGQSAALTIEHGPLMSDRLVGLVLGIYVPAVALLYTLQGFWMDFEKILYALTGAAAVAVCAFCILRGKLFRGADILMLLFMPVCAVVSAALNYGFSSAVFVSRPYVVWAVVFSLFFAIRVAPEPDRLFSLFASASVLGLSILCLFVLIHATASLSYETTDRDLAFGCFQLGRLCGLTNANIFAFSCTALCLLSIYSFLRATGRGRIIWVLSGIIGWITLGLTNCRTGILCVSFCIGLLVFSAMLRSAEGKRGRLLRILTAAALGILAVVICTLSMYLPTIIYRAVLSLYCSLTGRAQLLAKLSDLASRDIIDDTGTVSDRFITWRRALEDIGKTPLRTWFGISLMNTDGIGGVTAGHHEAYIPHAHNTYLEMLRRFGIIGFALLAASAVRWCAAGMRCLFGPDGRIPARCLAAAAAGILLMGLMEPVPFPYTTVCSLSLPFFAICGYFMNDKRQSP
ncbi:MAG: O-antigen ligase family protein [Firmicutes bacterium]|nr:O-antigen ligase family protein [Bacillota bacterium]